MVHLSHDFTSLLRFVILNCDPNYLFGNPVMTLHECLLFIHCFCYCKNSGKKFALFYFMKFKIKTKHQFSFWFIFTTNKKSYTKMILLNLFKFKVLHIKIKYIL